MVLLRVPTHPGKREKPGNFISHAPIQEMPLKIVKMTKTGRNP